MGAHRDPCVRRHRGGRGCDDGDRSGATRSDAGTVDVDRATLDVDTTIHDRAGATVVDRAGATVVDRAGATVVDRDPVHDDNAGSA